MPGPAPKTDKWTARENKQQKRAVFLIVNGLVQVSNTSKQPRLAEPAAPVRKTQTLTLDLSIAAGSGPGGNVQVWKRASFNKKVAVDQYNSIDIRWDGKSIASCKVLDDDEHYQHLVRLTQAANVKFGKRPKPAPRSKPKTARRAKPKVARRAKLKRAGRSKPKPAARTALAGRARTARQASRKKRR